MGENLRATVSMSETEIDTYLAVHRPATMATIGPDGLIHQVAMYFAWLDGALLVLSKTKAQKIVNLRRDPRCSFHVESGDHYDALAGVNLAGRAELLEDPERLAYRAPVDPEPFGEVALGGQALTGTDPLPEDVLAERARDALDAIGKAGHE